MRIARLCPTGTAAASRSTGDMPSVFSLLLLFTVTCTATIHAQQTPARSSAAPAQQTQTAPSPSPAATPPAADPDSNQDTLDTIPPSDETEDGSVPKPPPKPAATPAPVAVPPPPVTAPRPQAGSAAAAKPAAPVNKPAPAPLAAAAPIAKPVPADAGGNTQRQQINDQCANLLYLARTLKAEVDKTTQDELSVPVVLDAGQIAQLAHQMRDEMKPVLSSRK